VAELLIGAAAASVYIYKFMPTLRVAYVNTEKLLNSYQAMVSARGVYQGEKQEWEHNLESLAHEARQGQWCQRRATGRQRRNPAPQAAAVSQLPGGRAAAEPRRNAAPDPARSGRR